MRYCCTKTYYLRLRMYTNPFHSLNLPPFAPKQVKNKYYQLTYLQTLDFLDIVVLGEDGGVW